MHSEVRNRRIAVCVAVTAVLLLLYATFHVRRKDSRNFLPSLFTNTKKPPPCFQRKVYDISLLTKDLEVIQPMKTNFKLSEKCKELSQSVFSQRDLERMCDAEFRKQAGMETFCLVSHPHLYKFPKNRPLFHVHVPSMDVSVRVPMYTYSKADMLSASLLGGVVWEKDIINRITGLLKQFPQAQLIDVGSNLGIVTLTVALGMNRRVFAIDANYNNAIRLGRTLMENKVFDRVSLFWNAIHDSSNKTFISYREEAGTCHIAAALTGRTKPNPESRLLNNMKDTTAEVNASRIDNFVPFIKTIMKEAVLKIDIEGAEWTFFKSSAKLFEAVKVHYVWMEWENLSRDQKKNICEFFVKRNYTILRPPAMSVMSVSGAVTGGGRDMVMRRN